MAAGSRDKTAPRDKVEPFWSRPSRSKRVRTPAPPPPEPEVDEPEIPERSDPDAPQEPTFVASRAERRETIAALIAGTAADDEALAAPAGPTLSRATAAADEPAPSAWVALSAEEARRHPLFGLGGWMLLIAALTSLGLFRALVELFDFWATTDHGGMAAWIMAVLRSTMAVWAALILGLMLGHSGAFPANFMAYGLLNIIYLGLFGLAFAHVTQNASFIGSGIAAAATLIAMGYIVRSRRVNVTFRRRIRARDAMRKGAKP